jgi:hypothetical protein
MKKLLPLILCTFALWTNAQQLTGFNDILTSLQQGKKLRVVIQYGNCQLKVDGVETKSPAAIGGMTIDAFEYFPANLFGNANAFIAFSETILISHRKYGYVYNYVKLKMLDNNKVEVTARYLQPKKLKVVMDETFYCELNDAKNNGGISVYVE